MVSYPETFIDPTARILFIFRKMHICIFRLYFVFTASLSELKHDNWFFYRLRSSLQHQSELIL